MQPWQTYVASGSLRDQLRAQMMGRVQSKVPPNQDHKSPNEILGRYTKIDDANVPFVSSHGYRMGR